MKYLKEYMVDMTGFYTYMLQRISDEGYMHVDEPSSMAIGIMGIVDGLMNYMSVFPESDIDVMVGIIRKTLLREEADLR